MDAVGVQVAQGLLDIGAVCLSPQKPFTWASGIKSPIYTDNRLIIGNVNLRKLVAKGLAKLISEKFPDVEVIGGVATAGIAHAALVADILDLPMIYVRSKPKDHGTNQKIEGLDIFNKKVVLIDDLLSTGGSVLKSAENIKAATGQVLGVVAIFSYNLPINDDNFKQAKIKYATLTNFNQLITVAKQREIITKDELLMLETWHTQS
ncbi:orotate phosphoribosyltransferase [Weissella beninensis]|uniref:Orotate phosphoribosyltransferase n=1 Tax=Periweissella beninensis TaxID=504936 RepID=A0ABT0VIA1_9LACO|nr:orotate phosphoribosyltransferase [Periweissella beninensis]MBM7544057.1 orotate phosphoribosyltransferase [Periweissella beninensis]MCM2437386.1 orotate phosphoribosyltransferase [Periweissella beninensis]